MSAKGGVAVVLPEDLHEKIRMKIRGTEFESVESYVLYVLREVLSDEVPSQTYSKEEQEQIETRLKSLGYL